MVESKYPSISVVIPAFNEGNNIAEVLRRIMRINWPLDEMEIVVVDDGSTDNTPDEIANFPFVKYIRHDGNKGKGAAVRTGIKNSTGKVVVIQDADLEYPPEYVPYLVKPILADQADVVYGSRFMGKRKGMTFSHFVGNRILSLIAQLFYNVKITDIMTGHKAFSRDVLNSFDLNENGFAFEVEVTSKIFSNGWRFLELPVDYYYRKNGVSKIAYSDGLKSLLRLLIDKLEATDFSEIIPQEA